MEYGKITYEIMILGEVGNQNFIRNLFKKSEFMEKNIKIARLLMKK